MDLSEIRKNIDEIDEQLLSLFLKRMECSRGVAEYKTANNMPVLNVQREQEILDNIAAKSGDKASAAKLLFSTIMDISRAAQYPLVSANAPLRKEITSAKNAIFEPECVGCQGTAGSYSQMAAQRMYPNAEIKYYPTFEDVFNAVSSGEIEGGIIPIENSYAGSVVENSDLLIKHDLHINCAYNLPVCHCLVANKGADIKTVKTVISHEQALNQCSDFIKEHGYAQKSAANTAIAAKQVADGDDITVAAIASEATAELYGLQILARAIQTSDNNTTKFVAIAKNMAFSDDSNCISISFCIPHTPGSLYKTLSKLAAYGMNMTKIESRPDRHSPFQYVFSMDFTGSLCDESTVSVLCGMCEELPVLNILGNYKLLSEN